MSIKYLILIILFVALNIFLVGCSKTNSNPLPVASFSWSAKNQDNPSLVSFINNSQNATSYLWEFGDGNTSTDFMPTHQYVNGATFNVKLTALGSGQNTSVQQVNVTSSTSLQLLVVDSIGKPVPGAVVQLFVSSVDYFSNINPYLTQVTDQKGVATFIPLSVKVYWWSVTQGCMTNIYGGNTSHFALQSNTMNKDTTQVLGTGSLIFKNTSSDTYDVYVNSNLLISNMPSGTSQTFTALSGNYTIEVIQKTGYLIYPTDVKYTGQLVCGGSLSTNFP